jgi:predicted permease
MAQGRENFTFHAGLNWRVLAVNLALSLVTGILFGLAPAIQAARTDLTPALKSARSAGAGPSFRRRGRRVSLSGILVAAQVAISLFLVAGAGLFVRTLSNLHSVDLGFNRENLLLFSINAKQAGYQNEALPRFYENLRARLTAIPGVRSVSGSSFPLVSGSSSSQDISIAGRSGEMDTNRLEVTPEFFSTMQIPILLGRAISARDADPHAPVAVVNEVFAGKYFPGVSPVGQRFTFNSTKQAPVEIIGVARNARYNQLKGEIPPVVYVAYAQATRLFGPLTFELRSSGNPLALAGAARAAVREANDRIPVTELRTQAETIDQTIQESVVFARLCGAFAVLALLIAAVGLYGTMAYAVARRTGEIGIRMALGARGSNVAWLVLRDALLMTAGGLALGIPAAYSASQLVESYLFGIKARDPLALAAAAGVMIAAAVAASYLPAWRAARINPMTALRQE